MTSPIDDSDAGRAQDSDVDVERGLAEALDRMTMNYPVDLEFPGGNE